jgi:hypothetical protein
VVDVVDAGVEKDVRLGIRLMGEDDDGFDAALATLNADSFFAATSSGERWQISTIAMPHWPQIRQYAERGYEIQISRGTLGINVASILRSRLDEFERVLTQVSEGAAPPELPPTE